MQETQETWVQSLVWEDALKEEVATHSSILAWRIPWTEEPGGLESIRSQRVGHDKQLSTHTHTNFLSQKNVAQSLDVYINRALKKTQKKNK